MENRMVKFYSKESSQLVLHAIPGHFATSHSHINYYVDVTSIKTRASEAKEAAKAYFLSQVAEETPDVRSDLVASVKEKIKDPNYLNSVTIGSAADRILDSWGF